MTKYFNKSRLCSFHKYIFWILNIHLSHFYLIFPLGFWGFGENPLATLFAAPTVSLFVPPSAFTFSILDFKE